MLEAAISLWLDVGRQLRKTWMSCLSGLFLIILFKMDSPAPTFSIPAAVLPPSLLPVYLATVCTPRSDSAPQPICEILGDIVLFHTLMASGPQSIVGQAKICLCFPLVQSTFPWTSLIVGEGGYPLGITTSHTSSAHLPTYIGRNTQYHHSTPRGGERKERQL